MLTSNCLSIGLTDNMFNGQIEEIRDRYEQGEKLELIYESYGISKAHFSRIISEIVWNPKDIFS